MANGAEFLVRQMKQCEHIVGDSIKDAYTDRDNPRGNGTMLMEQALQFMRLAGEIGTALAKLKPNNHRQHMTIERVGAAQATAAIAPKSPRQSDAEAGYARACQPEDVRKKYESEPSVLGNERRPEYAKQQIARLNATRAKPASAGADSACDDANFPTDAALEKALAGARAFVAEWGDDPAVRGEGEGEGYDKQLDVVDADLEPAS